RSVADEVERAILAIQTEQETRDLLATRAVADDDAVDRAVVFDLLHSVPRAGHVREIGTLCDDAVEAEHLEPLEPHLGLVDIARDLRELEALRVLFEECAPLRQWSLMDGLTVPEQHVEGDEARRDLTRQLADPRLGGMQPHL